MRAQKAGMLKHEEEAQKMHYNINARPIQRWFHRIQQRRELRLRFAARFRMLEAARRAVHEHQSAIAIQKLFRARFLCRWLAVRTTARGVPRLAFRTSVDREVGATFLQRAWVRCIERQRMNLVFAARRHILDLRRAKLENQMALRVQIAYRRSQGRYAEFMRDRAARLAREEEERKRLAIELAARRQAAAFLAQRNLRHLLDIRAAYKR